MWNRAFDRFCVHFPVILAISALGFLASCGGGNSTTSPPNPTLQSITVSPQQATVAAGLTQQFSARGNYSDGTSQTLSSVTWSTSDKTVATVDGKGLVTTIRQSAVTISATSGAITNKAQLTVGPPIPIALDIVPPNPSVSIGTNKPTKLYAMLIYSDKSSTDISDAATWSSANHLTATIDSSGSVTALSRGYTTIRATNGTFAATTGFAVTAAPRYLYFMSNAGRVASKAVIDSGSGQLHMAGYIPTGANNYSSFHCATTDPEEKYLYVGASIFDGQNLSGEVQIYSVDPATGSLTTLPGSPFPQATPVQCIDFEPTGRFGYATTNTSDATEFLTFSVDPVTGMLTLLNSDNLSLVPSRAAIDPLGKYLYLVGFSNDFSSASALGYSIDSATGTLTPIPGTPFPLSNIAGAFSFHPSGDFLYLADTNGASIDTYSVDRSTGKLTAVGTISTCVNPTIVRFSPNAKVAYTACSMDAAQDPNSASVDSFTIGSDGRLTHLASTPSAIGAFDLTVDPSGQFLYLSEATPYIHLFQVGSDGSAKLVRRFGVPPSSGFTTVASGGSIPVKNTPKAAYITSAGDNTFSTYGVNTDGTLTSLQSVPTQTPFFSLSVSPPGTDIAMASAVPSPNLLAFPLAIDTGIPGVGFLFGDAHLGGGVAIDSSGQFAFATDSAQGAVYIYSKTGSSWTLTYSGTFAGSGAGPIVVDPSGVLVYVANQGGDTISAYQYWGISPQLFESNGQYVAPYTDGSPYFIGAEPISLAVDPNEAFLYVLCADHTLRMFAIDYSSGGHLAQVGSAPLTGQPVGLTVEPTGQFVYTSDSTGVRAFSVDATSGTLTSVALNPPVTLANITGVYAEPAGKYLYVTTGAQNVAGAVFAYSIGKGGNLTAVSVQPVATPLLPSSMAFTDDIR